MIKFWIYLLTIFQILQMKVKEVRRMTAIVKASNKTTGRQCVNKQKRYLNYTLPLYCRRVILGTQIDKQSIKINTLSP